MARRGMVWIRRLAWATFALMVSLVFAKFFLADVYPVSSGSMRPTIFGGPPRPGEAPFTEWVLVAYDRDPRLERFDLVVLDLEGVGAVVKRVVGLPLESIRILDGDLLVNGERLPAEAPRPSPVVVFDSLLLPVEDYFHFRHGEAGPWRSEDEVWILNAEEVPPGSFAGMMSYHPELRDDYLDPDGRRVVGRRTVNDAILECEFAFDRPQGRLRFMLMEKADTFEVRLTASDPSAPEFGTTHVLELLRRSAPTGRDREDSEPVGVLERLGVDLAAGEWHRLRFSNVDNHLEVQLSPGSFELLCSYENNELHPDRIDAGDQHIGSRAELGGAGLVARFRRIRILRDLHYTSAPEEEGYGVGAPQPLGPDEVFVLGDNSVQSQDSRSFGPVPLSRLIGRPVWVLWPPGRLRRLAERAEGLEGSG